MSRRVKALPAQTEARLFDALTSGRRESLRDVAGCLSVSPGAAGMLITRQRAAAAAGLSWWTVPHAARGKGGSLYCVVEVGGTQVLSEPDYELLRKGHLSSVQAINQETRNGATAWRILAGAEYLPLSLRAGCLAQAIMMEQSAAMMEGVIRELGAYPQLTLAA